MPAAMSAELRPVLCGFAGVAVGADDGRRHATGAAWVRTLVPSTSRPACSRGSVAHLRQELDAVP